MDLRVPRLRRNDARRIPVHDDPLVGAWVAGMLSRGYEDVRAASFDYVLDWRTERLQTPFFLKRTMDGPGPTEPPPLSAILAGDAAMAQTAAFCAAVSRPLDLVVIDDGADWSRPHPSSLLRCRLAVAENLAAAPAPVRLEALQDEILRMRGPNPARHPKPLAYATTSLEAHLAASATPWPGDADLVLHRAGSFEPVAILEMKKHTEASERPDDGVKFEDQGVLRYLKKDFRKYASLSLLAEQLVPGRPLPLYALYYTAYRPSDSGPPRAKMAMERIRCAGPRVFGGVKLFSQELPPETSPERITAKLLREIERDLKERPVVAGGGGRVRPSLREPER